jgi:hypothetical protein
VGPGWRTEGRRGDLRENVSKSVLKYNNRVATNLTKINSLIFPKFQLNLFTFFPDYLRQRKIMVFQIKAFIIMYAQVTVTATLYVATHLVISHGFLVPPLPYQVTVLDS